MSAPHPAHRYVYGATVRSVRDGDTIDLLIDLGLSTYRQVRVRILRLDTCESSPSVRRGGERVTMEEVEIGVRAKARAEELLPVGSKVLVRTHLTRSGRVRRGYWKRVLADLVLSDGSDYATLMRAEGYDRNDLGFGTAR